MVVTIDGVVVPTSNEISPAPWRERFRKIFAEKEIFFRSHGRVRFLRISSRFQIVIACLLGALLTGWLIATFGMLYNQATVAYERTKIEAKARTVAAEANKVNAYKRSVSDIAADLGRRQDMLDDMVQSQFGASGVAPDVVGEPDQQTQSVDNIANATAEAPVAEKPISEKKVSDSSPSVEKLRAIETRQTRFAQHLVTLIDERAARAEAAIRSFGLKPEQIATRAALQGQGGPYVSWDKSEVAQDDALAELANALARLNALEHGLIAIPSGRPTSAPMLSSSYGYRRDPFNGRAAFHSGVDFRGRYGQPILAAATGRVAYAGRRQGYGKVVEIDHGHGIMTRYAHLSAYAVKPGQKIARGITIGRMGSTGRSTGTHLHFEVRVNGAAINPRRFLEVKEDVLKAQQIAKQRVARVRSEAVKSDERS